MLLWLLLTAGGTAFIAALAILDERFGRGRDREPRAGFPTPGAGLPTDYVTRLEHLTLAVDSIALEVERLGEGQRFVTKLLAERAQVPTATRSPQPGTIQTTPRPTA